MKKTLLATAMLLAFVSYANADPHYIEEATEIAGNTENYPKDSERVLGGFYVNKDVDPSIAQEKLSSNLSSNVKVTGGDFNYVVGGHYVSDYEKDVDLKVNSTNVVIDGRGTKVYFLAAGTASNNARLSNTSQQSSLTIHNGTFGTEKLTTNVMENMVLGGDLVKGGSDIDWSDRVASTSIKKVNISIDGGTFNSVVIGGSAAYAYYEKPYKQIKTSVDEVEMSITGGTFNLPIFAGGMAGGHNTESTVGTAKLFISGSSGNLSINNVDIYAGGLMVDAKDKDRIASVENAIIQIENTTLKGVFGTAADSAVSGDGTKGYHWDYSPIKDSENIENVNTALSLTNVTAETVDIPLGNVELRAEGADGGVNVDSFSVDKTTVRLTADGAANDAAGGDVDKLFSIQKDGDTANYDADIAFDEGLVMGELTGKVVNGQVDEKTLTVKKNTVQNAMLDLMSKTPVTITRTLTNDVRKRLGDIRSAQGTHGVWARYDGGKFSADDGFENDFNTIQVGYDTLLTADAPRLGVAFSYTKGDTEFGRGDSDLDAYSLAAYATKLYDNGMFVDVIGRVATINNDMTVDGRIDAKTDNLVLSLSGEYGWRFSVTDMLYVEPQAELTYTYVDSDSFKLDTAKYEMDSTDSLVARIGLATGFKCPADMGDVYVRVSGVHEFLGDSEVSASNEILRNVLKSEGEDTWVEFNLGANFNINKSTYIYADVERTEGAKLEEDWRANVGVRYSF